MAVGVGLVLVVAYLSLTPNPIEVGGPEEFDLGHFSACFTLMMWWAQLVRAGWLRAAVAVALVALGVALEAAQGLTDYRTFDPLDMRANAVGVAAGFLLALTPLGRVLAALERRLPRASR